MVGTTETSAYGIKLTYTADENYTAGKTFTLKLTFSADGAQAGEKLTLDGEDATEAAVVEGVSVLVK